MVFALAVLALLLLENQSSDTPVVAALTVATLIAVVVRLAITFAENRHLLDRLQRDLLTGLPNRGKLFIDLPRALEDEQPHLVAILDLDGFKAYNDAFGHGAGDALLIRLGRQLEAAVKGNGRAYRLGGDEFAVLARGNSESAARAIADASSALIEHGEGFSISSSCGFAEIPREASETVAALELADKRMYEQKDSRRPAIGGEVQAVLLRIIQHRAPELSAHGNAVAELSVQAGRGLGISGGELEALRRAAELHDIGKVAIPDAILEKPGPLSDEEWRFMEQHTVLGERILSAADSLAPLGCVVRATHERWDGGGYPDGVSGEEIPLAARIIFACDALDAITTDRPYAPGRSVPEAVAELRACAGTQFDPRVVDALCAAIAERERDSAPPEAGPDRHPGLTLSNEQGLHCAADRPPLVEQGGVGDADAVRLGERDCVEADPLPLRHPMEVHAEIDVDEQVGAPVERRADPVPGVRRDQHALQRRRLLLRQQRHPRAHPHRRRPGLHEGARDEPVLHRRVVADVVAGLEELPRLPGSGARWRLGEPRRALEADRLRAQPPALGPHQFTAVLVAERRGDHLDAPTRADHLRRDPERRDRHRPQHLVGDAPELGRRSLGAADAPVAEALELPPDQRRRGPGVL